MIGAHFRSHLSLNRLWRTALGLAVGGMLLAGACPLDHTNPWDPSTPVQFSISGPTASHGIGDTLVYTASIDPRWSGGPPQWFSSDESVIRLVSGGHYVTVAVGTAEVIAHLGPHETRMAVSVSQILKGLAVRTCNAASPDLTYLQQSVSLCPILVDSAGGAMSGIIAAALSSSNPSVATVAGNNVVAQANGTTWIRGSAQGYTDSLLITVQQVPRFVVLQPNPLLLPGGGGTAQITWQVLDNGRSPMPGNPGWTTTRVGVIDVSQTGLVTATGWGVATITAQFQNAVGTLAVQTTGGTAPRMDSLSAVGIPLSGHIFETVKVVDAQGDALRISFGGRDIPLSYGTGVQRIDGVFTAFGQFPTVMDFQALDESGNTIDTTIVVDTFNESQAPVVLSGSGFKIGTDSLRVDFVARDNEMDAVEVWLVAAVSGNSYYAPAFVRSSLPLSATAQFSGSVGVRHSTTNIQQLGVIIKDATGGYSEVFWVPTSTSAPPTRPETAPRP